MGRRLALLSFFVFCMLFSGRAAGAPLSREALANLIVPPYALGEQLNENGVWTLLNSGGAQAGYAFETGPLAPLPGFSGAPINMLVLIDREGRFLDVRLIAHNEPIFVSGLGEAPLRAFLEQYRGHSIREALVVGTPYGEAGGGSSLVYLDGVTKATASVRIAHETILAATLAVAREKMQGVTSGPPVHPDPSVDEKLEWTTIVERGLARHLQVTNAKLDEAFAGTKWADDDPEAATDPDGLFLDLWVVDIGPPAIARAVLSKESFADLQRLLRMSPDDEPVLVIDAGRHGLVSADFVRNTAPDRLSAAQDGLPVALRDADMTAETGPGVPHGQQERPVDVDHDRLGGDLDRHRADRDRGGRRALQALLVDAQHGLVDHLVDEQPHVRRESAEVRIAREHAPDAQSFEASRTDGSSGCSSEVSGSRITASTPESAGSTTVCQPLRWA